MSMSAPKTAFLSTLPVRGATLYKGTGKELYQFLSTLPVRGATDRQREAAEKGEISIHAPREGSDHSAEGLASLVQQFLSTLPVRGATLESLIKKKNILISIHAPREGSDMSSCKDMSGFRFDFYPRSP